MRREFLVTIAVLVSQACLAQYYYDRSKLPSKAVQNETVTTTSSDFMRYFSVSWDFNSPMSNTQFVGTTSAAGVRISYRKRINDVDNLWVGFDFGAASYSQFTPYQTYISKSSASATSTDFHNYVTTYSFTCSIDYFFLPVDKGVAPFIGVAVGGVDTNFAQYYNVNTATDNEWGMQVRPEAGILVNFKDDSPWKLKAAVHYDYASNTSNFTKDKFLLFRGGEYKNFVSTGFQIGIVRMIK